MKVKRNFKFRSKKQPPKRKFARTEYIEGSIDHQRYYGQMLNTDIIGSVVRSIGVDRILDSKDEHFNDIPLNKWDQATRTFEIVKWPEGDTPSQAGLVCVAKAGAREFLRMYGDGDLEIF